MKRIGKHFLIIIPVMMVAMMLTHGITVYAGEFLTDTDAVEVVEETSYDIIDGVREGDLKLQTSSGTSTAHVLTVSPNAKAKFKALIPGYYGAGSTEESRAEAAENWGDSDWANWLGVSDMVKEYQDSDGSKPVLAAINGDFYGSYGKAPNGAVVLEGNKLMAHSNANINEYFFALKNNGNVNIFRRDSGQRNTIEEGICAPFWILRDGDPCYDFIDNKTAPEKRTAAGIKPDGEILIITVENPGLSLEQLAELMKASGCVNGVNFDGGRSITFLTKRAGESDITRKSTLYYSENGTYMERPTASALMLVADDDSVANKVIEVSGSSLTTDKDTYKAGEAINVTAYSDIEGAWVSLLKADDDINSKEFFWYYVNGRYENGHGDVQSWANKDTYDICTDAVSSSRDGVDESISLEPGAYKVVMLKHASSGSGYELITEKQINITEPDIPDVDYTLETDKTTYEVGEAIQFKATAPIAKTWVGIYLESDIIPKDMSFFWYTLTVPSQDKWCKINVPGENVTEQDRHDSEVTHQIGTDLPPGDYKIILFETFTGDSAYNVKVQKNITISEKVVSGKVTYMDGDKEIEGMEPSRYYFEDSATAIIAFRGTPEKEGHEFVGWYGNKELTGRKLNGIPKGSTGDLTFYAKFDKKAYTIKFQDGDNVLSEKTVLYQDPVEKPEDPVKDGFEFLGWVTEPNGSSLFDFEKGVSGDTTVYASWLSEGDHRVSFDTDGGSLIADQGVKEGEKAVRPQDPEKEGFDFAGWFADKDLTAEFDFDNTEITEDITIYAKWTVKAVDKLVLSEESREKEYSGGISSRKGAKVCEYFYGDEITVEASSVNSGAWVGVYNDPSAGDSTCVFNGSGVSGEPLIKYYLDDYDDQKVDLLSIDKQAVLPFKPYSYWAVLISADNEVIMAEPFNYRTFNMDWADAVDKNIVAELEWTTAVMTGKELRPALTIKQVNENYSGTFTETLTEGTDYTVEYPSASKAIGTYVIKVHYTSPSTENNDNAIHYMGNTVYEYKYTITASENDRLIIYELNGGTNHRDNPETYQEGSELALKSPAKVGYAFCGWYEDENFDPESRIESIAPSATGVLTLYAKWADESEAPYHINYVLNGGSDDILNPGAYTGEANVDLRPAKKAGCTFDGWFYDNEFIQPADVITKGTTGDVTVYAKFSKKPAGSFIINTEVKGGSISDNTVVSNGADCNISYEPNKGYTLKSISVDGESVDISLYPDSYTFTDVMADHTISVVFEKNSAEPVSPAAPSAAGVTVGYQETVGGSIYTVTSVDAGTADLTIAVNKKTVTIPETVILAGKTFKVTSISPYAFKSSAVKTITVKSKYLTKAGVKGSLKGSKVKTVKVKVGKKKTNKKYVKKYKKFFMKKNAGKKVKVR